MNDSCKVLIVLWLFPAILCAQEPPKKRFLGLDSIRYFRVIMDVGGGFSGSQRPEYSAWLQEQYRRGGLAGTFSIRATANDLLSVGIKTGFLTLSRSGYKDTLFRGTTIPSLNAALYSIPILLQVDVQKWNFHLSGGFGAYYLYSKFNFPNESDVSGGWFMGYSLGFGYLFPLSNNLTLGPQGEWHYIPDESKHMLLLQLKLSYTLRW